MKNRKGFTIVELVIVIAVIAILAAVLIPTFTTVTKNAKISAAQSQAKNGLDQIIALTGGQMTEGSLFCVSETAGEGPDYYFAFTKNALKQVNKDNREVKGVMSTSNPSEVEYYQVYVTAECFNAGTSATAIPVAETAIAGALGKELTSWNAAGTADTGKSYATWTAMDGEDTITFRVYYAAEINDTMVVFIA